MEIVKINKDDNLAVKKLIHNVMPEFGAKGDGFALSDPEVENMYMQYSQPRHIYFVVKDGDNVYGGGGIGPLNGEEEEVCELRKMYFMPELRGKGYGQKLMELCLEEAQRLGFKKCYLETLEHMKQAKSLYEKNGFKKLNAPLGNTGHHGCNNWYLKDLI